MRISVVTPTKDRPEAVALCRRWIAEQITPAHEHIVEEGGEVFENFARGIEKASGDVIALVDDDDYYAPEWLSWVARTMQAPNVDYAGQIVTRMFHIRAQRWQPKMRKGPLPGTMVFRIQQKARVLEQLARLKTPKKMFWVEDTDPRVRAPGAVATDVQYITHIKGLYHTGQSVQHEPSKHPEPDPGLEQLRHYIGATAVDAYLEAIEAIDARARRLSTEGA